MIVSANQRHKKVRIVAAALLISTAFRLSVAFAAEPDLPALAARARPAVVLISVMDSSGEEIARATGFFASEHGTLVTCKHVLERAVSAAAKAESGAYYKINGILAEDSENDLILLQAEARGVAFLTLTGENDTAAAVGQRVFVIGNPLGLEGSLTDGIISSYRELAGGKKRIQMTAPISAGSSGSPVLTVEGKVAGLVAATVQDAQSLNFAIPSELIRILIASSKFKNEIRPLGSGARPGMESDQQKEPKAAQADADFARESAEVWRSLSKFEKVNGLVAAGRLARKYPERLEAQKVLVFAYIISNLTDDGIDLVKRLLIRNDADAELWAYLARCYDQKQDYTAAVNAYKRSIALEPRNPGTWTSLAQALVLREPERRLNLEALEACNEALKLDPESSIAYGVLGMVYEHAGLREKATEALRNAASKARQKK